MQRMQRMAMNKPDVCRAKTKSGLPCRNPMTLLDKVMCGAHRYSQRLRAERDVERRAKALTVAVVKAALNWDMEATRLACEAYRAYCIRHGLPLEIRHEETRGNDLSRTHTCGQRVR